jgi:hypothetical protein
MIDNFSKGLLGFLNNPSELSTGYIVGFILMIVISGLILPFILKIISSTLQKLTRPIKITFQKEKLNQFHDYPNKYFYNDKQNLIDVIPYLNNKTNLSVRFDVNKYPLLQFKLLNKSKNTMLIRFLAFETAKVKYLIEQLLLIEPKLFLVRLNEEIKEWSDLSLDITHFGFDQLIELNIFLVDEEILNYFNPPPIKISNFNPKQQQSIYFIGLSYLKSNENFEIKKKEIKLWISYTLKDNSHFSGFYNLSSETEFIISSKYGIYEIADQKGAGGPHEQLGMVVLDNDDLKENKVTYIQIDRKLSNAGDIDSLEQIAIIIGFHKPAQVNAYLWLTDEKYNRVSNKQKFRIKELFSNARDPDNKILNKY